MSKDPSLESSKQKNLCLDFQADVRRLQKQKLALANEKFLEGLSLSRWFTFVFHENVT